jgi:type IV pilus assembly protein PilY1
MISRLLILSTVFLAIGAAATELDISDRPLEIPQGAAPNIVVIMDDSGSMDWEITTTGYDNDGAFAYNNPFKVTGDTGDEIRHKRYSIGAGICTLADTPFGYYGYVYGVEFSTNAYPDDPNDCNTADEKAWRFRNSDYNALYYDPTRTYRPWPGLSTYTSTKYPDGVPYEKLVEQFMLENSSLYLKNLNYLVGFDNPTDPVEWLDLTVNNTNWDELTGAHGEGTDGFSYFTMPVNEVDGTFGDGDRLFEGYFDNSGTYVGPDGVVEVRVKDLDTALEKERAKDPDPNTQENFQNWFNFYRSREFSVKGAMHYVLEDMITARIGYTTINSTGYNYPVATMNPSPYAVGGNKHLLLSKIDATQPNQFNETPLRTALKGVGEYFSASSTDNRFGAGADPYLPADAGGTCQQNYALLFTDGVWNGAYGPGVGNTDVAGSAAIDGRGPFDGATFGDGWSDTLADVAMHYYETDLNADYDNEVPVTATDRYPERWPTRGIGPIKCDPDDTTGPFSCDQTTMHQNMKTYTIAFGLEDASSVPGAWLDPDPDPTVPTDPARLDDLNHAAYNGRGNSYTANNFRTLASELKDSFSIILAEQSGAAGVSFNSQELKTGTYIFRAFYNPTTFDGDLVAIEFDENGVPLLDTPVWSASEKLEEVISARARVIVSFDPDANLGDGAGIPFDYVTGIAPDTGPGLNATQMGYFQTRPPGSLPSGYGDYADERVKFLHGDQSKEGTRFKNGELRERAGLLGDFANSTPRYVGIPQGVKRDSEPYPTASADLYSEFKGDYLDRDQLVYAGANDGMLHGFDAVTGRERFAFVPNVVMDNLYEFTLPDYIHEMSVDGSPGINDIFIDDARIQFDKKHWRTVLMGGLRAGGKGYYALDITDPSTFTKADMPANVMWEFTSANDDRLGLSFSTPNMVMSNAEMTVDCPLSEPDPSRICKSPRWISLFGNGYNQTNTDGQSALFALFMDRGGNTSWNKPALSSNTTSDDWIVMQTGVGAFTDGGTTYPNGLGIPRAIDTDGNGTADYVYAGDLVGNLYRFDISNSDPAYWAMKQILFKAQYEVSAGVYSRQPITVQPIVTLNETYGGYIVIASTGSWMTVDDVASTTVQSLYGIWDPDPNVVGVGVAVRPTEIVEQAFSNVSAKLLGYSYRTLTALAVPYKMGKRTGSTTADGVKGWKIDFDICGAKVDLPCPEPGGEPGGERAIRNLLVKEGVLFGVTILPSANAFCSVSPGGYLFSINSQTGGLVIEKPAFDLNADGSYDINDVNNANSDDAIQNNEVPAAIRIEDGLPSDIAVIDGGANEGSKVCYQTSTGELVCTNTNVDSKFPEGRLSWKELAD